MLKAKSLEERVADLEKLVNANTEFATESNEKAKAINRGLKDKGYFKGEELALHRKAIKHLIEKYGASNDAELKEFIDYYNAAEEIKLDFANELKDRPR